MSGKGSGNSEKFVLRIGTAKQTPKNQTYNQAKIYGKLLQMQMQLTEYLNNMDADRYDALNDEGYKGMNVSSSALVELQKFIDGDFAADGAEDDIVAEEDGQYYEAAPPKDKKKKKKRSSS